MSSKSLVNTDVQQGILETGCVPRHDSDDEYEEEEHLVSVELTGIIDSDILEKCNNKCKILGINTEKPFLQVDKYVFAGEYEDALGTCVIFEETLDHVLLTFLDSVSWGKQKNCQRISGKNFNRQNLAFWPQPLTLWRGVKKTNDERYTIPTVKQSRGSLMFWGCVSSKGTGNLVKIDCKMNTICYQKILEEYLHSSARKLCMGHTWTFQHDNDPKHKAKLTCHWLQQNKVKVLEWPSQFPDLNIIEPLWEDLKHAVHARQPRNLQELEAFCQEEWAALPSEKIKSLIHKYHKKLQAVIDIKGGNTQY
ncbi:general transcription factor 3C polypeptide 6 isoform X2 [Lithobates pipiens]